MKKFLSILLVLLAGFVIFIIFFSQTTLGPFYQARNETVRFAREHANIDNVEDFYWYNGTNDSYLSVAGTTGEGEDIFVVVQQSDSSYATFNQEDMISEGEAVEQLVNEQSPSQILETRIGMTDEYEPMWEISFKDDEDQLGYYYVSMETGEEITTINNL